MAGGWWCRFCAGSPRASFAGQRRPGPLCPGASAFRALPPRPRPRKTTTQQQLTRVEARHLDDRGAHKVEVRQRRGVDKLGVLRKRPVNAPEARVERGRRAADRDRAHQQQRLRARRRGRGGGRAGGARAAAGSGAGAGEHGQRGAQRAALDFGERAQEGGARAQAPQHKREHRGLGAGAQKVQRVAQVGLDERRRLAPARALDDVGGRLEARDRRRLRRRLRLCRRLRSVALALVLLALPAAVSTVSAVSGGGTGSSAGRLRREHAPEDAVGLLQGEEQDAVERRARGEAQAGVELRLGVAVVARDAVVKCGWCAFVCVL